MKNSKTIKTNDSGTKNKDLKKVQPEKKTKDSKEDKNVSGNKDNKPEEQVTDSVSEYILPAGTIIGTDLQSNDVGQKAALGKKQKSQ